MREKWKVIKESECCVIPVFWQSQALTTLTLPRANELFSVAAAARRLTQRCLFIRQLTLYTMPDVVSLLKIEAKKCQMFCWLAPVQVINHII